AEPSVDSEPDPKRERATSNRSVDLGRYMVDDWLGRLDTEEGKRACQITASAEQPMLDPLANPKELRWSELRERDRAAIPDRARAHGVRLSEAMVGEQEAKRDACDRARKGRRFVGVPDEEAVKRRQTVR